MKDIIIKRIVELAKDAESYNEPNAAVILFALAGSMEGNSDDMLAGNVHTFVKDVLMPNVKAKIAFGKISDN